MKLALLIFASLTSICAMASENSRAIDYSEKVLSFDDWTAKYPGEAAVLGLFRGYKEPQVTFVENGSNKSKVAKLTIYMTRIQTRIHKPATQISLKSFLDLGTLNQLDPEITHKIVGGTELMPTVAGHGPVANFKWCNRNDGKTYIALPDFEQNLGYLNGDHAWCSEPGRSVCIESCYLFNDGWQSGIMAYNLGKKAVTSNPAELKDYGIGMQAEVRIFSSEAEYGQNVTKLTNVSSPVRGIVEINIFYVNQVMQYGKIVAVFQDDPKDPNQTVVTSLNAIGVRTATFKKYGVVQDILKGHSNLFNTATGITAGIPVFTKNIAKSMANILEK